MTSKFTFYNLKLVVFYLGLLALAVFIATKVEQKEVKPSIESIVRERCLRTDVGDVHQLDSLVTFLSTVSDNLRSLRDSMQDILIIGLAKEAAKRYKLRWKILYGIWRAESDLNPSLVGDRGKAFGLGQVHLPTALYHYDSSFTREDLMNPLRNAFASAKVLSDYLKEFRGDYIYAIAAYNQGPTGTKWQYIVGSRPNNYSSYVEKVLRYSR